MSPNALNKIRSVSIAATMIFTAISVPVFAGTIGGTNYDWTHWEEVASLPAARQNNAAGVLNGALYAFGGYNSGIQTNVYLYNGTNWTETNSLPVAINYVAGDVLGGAFYTIGGWVAGGPQSISNVYQYNGTNWMETNSLPVQRERVAAGVLNGALYAIGGYSSWDATAHSNVYMYNGTNWTETNSLPGMRTDLAAGVLNGALYAFGGWTNFNNTPMTNMFRYDGTNWTEVQGLPAARAGLGAGVLNGRLYAIGGYNSGYQSNVYLYDGTNWTAAPSLPDKRANMAAGVFGGALYAIGGNNGAIKSNVFRYPVLTVYGGMSPSSGSYTGGYQVVITGTNLCLENTSADVTNVTLCGVSASVGSVAGSTQIVVTAGVGTPGQGDVHVYSVVQGESVKANGFTYIGSTITVLGTNGAAIANGESASAAKGTDFGSVSWGSTFTNTLVITNAGNTNLTISSLTTNGSGASAFVLIPASLNIAANSNINFKVKFAPPNAGTYTAAVQFAHNAANTSSPYIVYLAGTGAKHDQTITNFPNPGSQTITNTAHLFAQASSGLSMTNFTVISGSATISNFTNVTFSGAGSVSITASQAGNTNWNAAPAVTNTFNVSKAEQAALTFSPTSPQTYNTTNALSASGGSGTGVVCYSVESGPGEIVEATKL